MKRTNNTQYFYALIFLFVIIFTGKNSFSQIANNQFTHLTLEDGLSQSTVFAIVQDSKGFMWFGTHDGLNRYDGYNFTVFKNEKDNPKSISGNIIYSILKTKDNTLWIGTNGDGLNKFDSDKETFSHYKHSENNPNSISQNVIRCLYEDADGDFWLGTDNAGLNKMNRENGTFTHFKNNPNDENSLINDKVLDICMDKEGLLWIATSGGISIFNKKSNKFTNIVIGKESGDITDLFEDSEGTMWVATNLTGLYKFNKETKEFKNYQHDDSNLNSVSHNSITKIYEDKEGIFWITTSDGLNIFDKETEKFYTYKHNSVNSKSLISNNIASIYEDNSGIIWLGCYERGISKYDHSALKFKLFQNDPSALQSFPDKTVRSIFAENENSIWVGFVEGGLVNFNPKTNEFQYYLQNPNDPNSISSNTPTSILKDSKGNLWIGTWNGGLNKAVFETNSNKNQLPKIKKFIKYKNVPSDSNSLSNNSIQKIFEDKKGRLWIGTAGGLDIYDEKNDIFIRLLDDKDGNMLLNNNSIQSAIDSDSKGNIWVGTWDGLHKINVSDDFSKIDIQFFLASEEDTTSLSDSRIISLCIDKNNILWVGTFGGGLNKLDLSTDGKAKFENFTTADGLSNNVIYAIQNDDQGHIWMSTNKGLSKFNPEDNSFQNYVESDGLQNNEFFWGASCKAKNGEMFFGGINGFNSFFPKDVKNNPYVPPIVITQFKLFESVVIISDNSILKKSIINTDEIVLNYDENIISFEFSALHFSVPENNQYEYMLEGFNNFWMKTDSKKRIATYTNLDPGKYIFKVKGSSSDGVWNETGASLIIRVLPPFWKTTWFVTLSIIVILSIVFLIYKLRVRQIEKQKKILETQVKERTFELSQKNALLKSNNETIEEQNHYIKAGIRYAQTIQKAILPEERLIKKTFEAFIIFRPKDVVSGDFYWFIQTENYSFLAAVDCTGHGVPGAFMSLIGNRILTEIVSQKKIYEPSKILTALDKGVKTALKQDKTDNTDGMDVCLCRFEKTEEGNNRILFSGAKRPLFYVIDGEENILKIKGTRRTIGGHISKSTITNFADNEILLPNSSVLYLSTDGLVDQASPERNRFGSTKLVNLIKKIHSMPMSEQKKIIFDNLKVHQQDAEQRDDITLISVRLK